MSPATHDHIRISFDKSHLVTIGERLYGESLELLRELIANSYDADAMEVHVEVRPENLTVRDDGSGMDEMCLREFFRIGSQNKLSAPLSPRFRRKRIGQFGIGKFSALSACRRFRVCTQRDGYAAEAVFDKCAFEEEEEWKIPLIRREWNAPRGNGTTVILEELQKLFSIPDIERSIRERFPLDTPSFALFINGERLMPKTVVGRKFPIRASTLYGDIHGEIVLPNFLPKEEAGMPGIECTVRGIVICRSTFGMNSPLIEKLRGRVEADFLPITSDRSRFILDTPEYRAFAGVMEKELKKIQKNARDMEEVREQRKADETLKDALLRMWRAIRKNPDITPSLATDGEKAQSKREAMSGTSGESGSDEASSGNNGEMPGTTDSSPQEEQNKQSGNENTIGEKTNAPKEPPPQRVRVKRLKGDAVSARRITIGGMGITCALEHCGAEAPAAYTEGGIVFLNIDHPLYRSVAKKGKDLLAFHLSSLIARQVSLMFAESDARKAFAIQERLMRDGW